MTASELIVRLSQLPQDIEVVYDGTLDSDDGFRLIVVEAIGEIGDDNGNRFLMINIEIEEDGKSR